MKTITIILSCFLLFYSEITYAQSGSLDNSFGINGIVTTAIGSYSDAGYAIAIQSDGKILVSGGSDNSTLDQFALVRYNTTGLLDSAFGLNGKVTTTIGDGRSLIFGYGARSLSVQPDGKIVLAGESNKNGVYPDEFTLVRYHSNGSLDSSFGLDGIVLTNITSGGSCAVLSIVIQPDGKMVAAGYTYYPGLRYALARYKSDGALDSSFGIGGRVITAFQMGDGEALAVALQADGKILAAGSVTDTSSKFSLVRYKSNGALDSTFGTNGIVLADSGYGNSVVIQTDGKILLGGYTTLLPAFALLRYNPDGSPDNTFGTGGKVITSLAFYDLGSSLALQPDGKIILAGSSGIFGDTTKFGLVRYNTDGVPDSTFGSGGIVTTPIGLIATASGCAIQTDGKIVLAGTSDIYFALARYNSDLQTGVQSFSAGKNSLFIFPNPSSDKIRVSFSSNEQSEVQITNTLGQIVFAKKIIPVNIGAREEIDVSRFPKGMYLLKVITFSQKFEGKFLKY